MALAVATIVMIGSAAAVPDDAPLKTASNTDVSDLWWNPAEPGWGMQLVNTDDHVFATIFVYGADGKPTWFVAVLERTGSATPLTFTGKLYATTGSYYGSPYGSMPQTEREAGTMTFVLTDTSAGQLSYTVDGVSVSQPVQRQPLWFDNYSGSYLALMTRTATNCNNPALNGNWTGLVGVAIRHSGLTMTLLTLDLVTGGCQSDGIYFQLGRSGQFQGTYKCSSNDFGTTELTEMNNAVQQFSGRIKFVSSLQGCISTGRIMGLIPN